MGLKCCPTPNFSDRSESKTLYSGCVELMAIQLDQLLHAAAITGGMGSQVTAPAADIKLYVQSLLKVARHGAAAPPVSTAGRASKFESHQIS